MYENISKKLKALAKYILSIGIILSLILGIFIISYDDPVSLIVGICVKVFAPILFLISSWIIYAMGDMLERVKIIEEKLKILNETKSC